MGQQGLSPCPTLPEKATHPPPRIYQGAGCYRLSREDYEEIGEEMTENTLFGFPIIETDNLPCAPEIKSSDLGGYLVPQIYIKELVYLMTHDITILPGWEIRIIRKFGYYLKQDWRHPKINKLVQWLIRQTELHWPNGLYGKIELSRLKGKGNDD